MKEVTNQSFMKSILEKGLVKINSEGYLNLLIIVAPLLNFLTGINIDLYAPSLPAIAHYFNASMMATQNTITATLIGFAIGCILFGTLMDIIGRRRVILLGLGVYIIASFSALSCHHIEALIFIRFIQGMVISTASIGCRALILDNFKDHRLIVGLLYTSVTYSLGPIIAPFIGGILQHYFGWQANFLAYGFFALALIIVFLLFVDESLAQKQIFSLKRSLGNYAAVIKHRTFISGVVISSSVHIQQMIYPTVGAFIVENLLHRTAIAYGNSALLISCGYLLGTLTNRFLLKQLAMKNLILIGFLLMTLGLIVQIIFSFLGSLNLFTLITPILIMGYSGGLVFPNVLGTTLKLFADKAGSATAIFTCCLVLLAALGIFLISHVSVRDLKILVILFAVPLFIQFLFYFGMFKSILEIKPCPKNECSET